MEEVEVVFLLNPNITIQAKSGDSFQSVIDKFIQKSSIPPDSVNYKANDIIINPKNTVESYMSELNKKDRKITITVMEEVEVVFGLNPSITIQAKSSDSFQSVIDKFIQKASIPPDSVYYMTNTKIIEPQNTVESYMSEPNKKDRKIPITIIQKEKFDITPVIVLSKNIICPECKEICLFKIENCHIKLFNCINNHETKGIKFSDFNKTQEIDISKIVCGNNNINKEHKNNKGHSSNYQFYFCLTCKQNLCLLCKSIHDKKHAQIDYDMKNYICQKHNDNFIKFCKKCNSNICFACNTEHDKHEIIEFKKVNLEQTKKRSVELEEEIKTLENNVEKIINRLKDFVKTINIYYKINKNILENYDINNKKRNYQVFENINEIINNDEIYKRLKNINRNSNIIGKIREIFDLDFEMNKANIDNEVVFKNKEEKLNHIVMVHYIHNLRNSKKIRIFGQNFVEKNKYNCYLKVNGEIKQLCEYLEINNSEKDTLEIKLLETIRINNMSYLFYECETLKYIKFKWNTEAITDISLMFCKCTSLMTIEGISHWNTSNITNMSYLFSSCKSLKNLPDISNWNVQNVIDMNYMFNDCRSLESFPDLSKWKINKTLVKEGMFDGVDKKIIPKKFKSCLIF